MEKVSRSIDVPAAAEEVWAVVGDFNGLPRWNAGVAASQLSHEGRRRTLALKSGGSVVEDLVEYDPAERRISYSFVETLMPVSRHKATLEVIDGGAGLCTVRWSCEFEPKEGADARAVAAVFTRIFDGGLRELVGLFGGQQRG
jgi:hypothetical protein